MAMNLSARLDEARKRRAQGQREPDAHPLDLRFAGEDGLHYEGREIRTGETLDEQAWEKRATEPAQGLPAWNPRRAGRPDDFGDSAEVIDLTARSASPRSGDAPRSEDAPRSTAPIQLPAWAQDAEMYRPKAETPTHAGANDCTNCGGEPRVDVLDLLNGVARVECQSCGMRWDAPAGDFRDAP